MVEAGVGAGEVGDGVEAGVGGGWGAAEGADDGVVGYGEGRGKGEEEVEEEEGRAERKHEPRVSDFHRRGFAHTAAKENGICGRRNLEETVRVYM